METNIQAGNSALKAKGTTSRLGQHCSITLPIKLRGSRTIKLRSSVSSRGIIIGRIGRSPQLIRLGYESSLERACGLLALADSDTVDIVEQPFTLRYLDEHWKTRRYTFDYMITKRDGTRVAVEVKNSAQAAKSQVIAKVRRAAAKLVPEHADEVTVFSNHHFTRTEVENSELIVNCQKQIDDDADAQISATIKAQQGGMTISDLVRLSGLSGRGFPAVLRAMYRKELSWPQDRLIGPKMIVGREAVQ